ncbi:MAG: hypothetical protein KAI61_05970, partial [Alphaproteobacteria bacterium]|nr:hypothetical protein [Alphaproteobacteria bacterium]
MQKKSFYERLKELLYEHSYRKPLWLSAVLIVCFFTWASFASINQQVHGTGRIIPSGKVRSIQHLEGGIVDTIESVEGQTVKIGETLFVITDKKGQVDLELTKLALNSALIKQARLRTEILNKSVFQLDPDLEKKFPEIAATEYSIFKARTEEFEQKINNLQNKYNKKVLTLNQLRTTIINLIQEADVTKRQLAIKRKLRASGAISESQYLDTDSTVKNFQTQIKKSQTQIPII